MIDPTFAQLIKMDSDGILKYSVEIPPSKQAGILYRALRGSTKQDTTEERRAGCLTLSQSILASEGGWLERDVYLKSLEEFVEYSNNASSSRTKTQLLTIANFLAQRLGTSLGSLSKKSFSLLTGLSTENSVHETLAGKLKTLAVKARANQKQRMRRKGKFEPPQMDVQLAKQNVIWDIEQDWFSDPWNWPEFQLLTSDMISERLANDNCGWTLALDVPKSTDGVRPAIILDPIDRVSYQCLADELSVVASAALPEWVYGWRVKRNSAVKGIYEDNGKEWKKFKRRISSLSIDFDYVLRVDVRSFFEMVDTDSLVSDLGRKYKKKDTLERLRCYFEEWRTRPNGNGLPQRSLASSLLAHVPLRALDSFLSQQSNDLGTQKVVPLRWMDDIWLFGDSENSLRSISKEIEATLSWKGLGLNPNKSVLTECRAQSAEFYILTSGNDEAVGVNRESKVSTEVTNLVENIEESPRSIVGFLTRYKGVGESKVLNDLLIQFGKLKLEELNHSADRVADFLNRNNGWRSSVAWYRTFIREQADQQSWTVPSWARMFPEGIDSSIEAKEIEDVFARSFREGIQQSLIPIASHRLAFWNPTRAKKCLYEYLTDGQPDEHYMSLRSVAIAAKKAGLSSFKILEAIRPLSVETADRVKQILD